MTKKAHYTTENETQCGWREEITHLKAVNTQLLKAVKHIRVLVSPYLIGKDECDKLDAAIKAATEG